MLEKTLKEQHIKWVISFIYSFANVSSLLHIIASKRISDQHDRSSLCYFLCHTCIWIQKNRLFFHLLPLKVQGSWRVDNLSKCFSTEGLLQLQQVLVQGNITLSVFWNSLLRDLINAKAQEHFSNAFTSTA